tara:strand:- start:2307 stop:2438 length:132 start_codon:yes stop_codon:yes gene_type:complete
MKRYRISVEDMPEYIEALNEEEARKKAEDNVCIIEQDKTGVDK